MKTSLVLLGAAFMATCGGFSRQDLSACLARVFSDFTYGYSQPLDETLRSDSEPLDGVRPLGTFQPGYRYIFYHRLPRQNVELGTRILPDRLRKEGFQLIEFPKQYTDMKDTYIGGPLFLITCKIGPFSARIFNAVNMKIVQNTVLSELWSPDEYVIEVRQ